ncbi:hypothetical protein AB7C87_12395 [Natrarchaeobius sp. A-rgal3]|uniref:DUF7260 family protein n=1 Tax=Natrarchaeobius versutus TaxID=1679078 RepID=UPI003510329C
MRAVTPTHAALERVEAERKHVGRGLDAYDRFAADVRELASASSGTHSERTLPDGAGQSLALPGARSGRRDTDGLAELRSAFRETVQPFAVAHHDRVDSSRDAIGEELGDELAPALESTASGPISPALKATVLSAAERRRIELRTVERALATEEASLQDVLECIEGVADWLVDADRTPLSALDFTALSERHETLRSHHDRCETAVYDRQTVIRGRTARGTVVVSHRSLVDRLYRRLSSPHPALSTVVRVADVCRECRRIVRDHLVRRT